MVSFDGNIQNTVAIHPNECVTLIIVEKDEIVMKVWNHKAQTNSSDRGSAVTSLIPVELKNLLFKYLNNIYRRFPFGKDVIVAGKKLQYLFRSPQNLSKARMNANTAARVKVLINKTATDLRSITATFIEELGVNEELNKEQRTLLHDSMLHSDWVVRSSYNKSDGLIKAKKVRDIYDSIIQTVGSFQRNPSAPPVNDANKMLFDTIDKLQQENALFKYEVDQLRKKSDKVRQLKTDLANARRKITKLEKKYNVKSVDNDDSSPDDTNPFAINESLPVPADLQLINDLPPVPPDLSVDKPASTTVSITPPPPPPVLSPPLTRSSRSKTSLSISTPINLVFSSSDSDGSDGSDGPFIPPSPPRPPIKKILYPVIVLDKDDTPAPRSFAHSLNVAPPRPHIRIPRAQPIRKTTTDSLSILFDSPPSSPPRKIQKKF